MARAGAPLVNEMLAELGPSRHEEPRTLSGAERLSFGMYGYIGVHCLRRIAAHLWAGKALPPPGDPDSVHSDPLLGEYYANVEIEDGALLHGRRGSGIDPAQRFDHLVLHSDAEGYYLPIEFGRVILAGADEEGGDDYLGSAYAPAKECEGPPAALSLPLDLGFGRRRDPGDPGPAGAGREGPAALRRRVVHLPAPSPHDARRSIACGAAVAFVRGSALAPARRRLYNGVPVTPHPVRARPIDS